MDDVEARGEGLPSSTLRAIARNLDMARSGTSECNRARVSWTVDGQTCVDLKNERDPRTGHNKESHKLLNLYQTITVSS